MNATLQRSAPARQPAHDAASRRTHIAVVDTWHGMTALTCRCGDQISVPVPAVHNPDADTGRLDAWQAVHSDHRPL